MKLEPNEHWRSPETEDWDEDPRQLDMWPDDKDRFQKIMWWTLIISFIGMITVVYFLI